MLSKLQKILKSELAFLQSKKLLLATSGGIDSMVLAYLFNKLHYDIALAHCNFNLRGEESDGDEAFIREYAAQNNIPLLVTRFDTKQYAEDAKLSIQVAARELRYRWFYELMDENGFDYLLTAHHLDDSLETFLINFTRGTGLEGLTGIPQQNGRVIRPLLSFSRQEIEDYAKTNNISWREDSSNVSDKYLRNKLRHEVVPILKSLNSSFTNSFEQTLKNIQQAQSLAEDASVLIYKQVVTEKEKQKIINITELLRLPNYKAYLYQWLYPLEFKAWKDIYQLLYAQSGKYILSEGFRLLKDRNTLILEPYTKTDAGLYEIPIETGSIDYPISIKISNVNKILKKPTNNIIYVDAATLKFPLFARKWRGGDYFCPSGMKGQKKKVSKFFKDEKMSLSEKENTWLLCSGEDIIWIIGYRADERFKVTEETTKILKIDVL